MGLRSPTSAPDLFFACFCLISSQDTKYNNSDAFNIGKEMNNVARGLIRMGGATEGGPGGEQLRLRIRRLAMVLQDSEPNDLCVQLELDDGTFCRATVQCPTRAEWKDNDGCDEQLCIDLADASLLERKLYVSVWRNVRVAANGALDDNPPEKCGTASFPLSPWREHNKWRKPENVSLTIENAVPGKLTFELEIQGNQTEMFGLICDLQAHFRKQAEKQMEDTGPSQIEFCARLSSHVSTIFLHPALAATHFAWHRFMTA